MDIDTLREELRAYYYRHSFSALGGSNYRNPLFDAMDEHASSHPGLSPVQLKAAQYEIIADSFQPVVFKNSPFYSEMGVKVAEYDGVPGLGAGGWLFKRNAHLFRDISPDEYDQYVAASRNGIHLAYGPYADYDHHCFPYSNVLENGLAHIYAQAETALGHCEKREETEFVECAMRGLLAVKKIAGKFADAAAELLGETTEETQRSFLGMIAETATEVPWRKPETFYEGLCAIWFLHEVCASIEGIGMSVVGHLDRMLGELYRSDLEAGRLTPDEAYDLICRFMIYTDCKFDSTKPVDESYNRQEQGEVVILGGCDEAGREIVNDITFMVLKAHHELGMLYPKIHCRITRNAKQEYLDAINRDFIGGRNVIAFLNDECLIPAQVKAGKRLSDARRYVAGGCWEVILEGYEHSAGANCYLNLLRIMDMSIHEHPELAVTGVVCDKIDGAEGFEDVYRIVLGNVIRAIRQMCQIIEKNGSVWPRVSPAPFFSACLADCLANRTDYTAGGGRYNPHGLPMGGFANFVDSLLAIRELCFGNKQGCTLDDLLEAVRANWEGHETLRAKVLTMPHFGDNAAESNTLASRILDDIYENTRDLKNERGGPFQLGLYIYREIIYWGMMTRATPDGRRSGDVLTQGITPSRLHHAADITSTINSGAALDLTQCPANSVLTVSLPLGGVNLQTLGQFERAFAASGLAMLQL
ncbi:MAG: pyruvate formate lyase family protein, partial [Lentisphaeria bacterium]|nr:pyruvate formate lyase family protein [Lentisphaeria bacterium]